MNILTVEPLSLTYMALTLIITREAKTFTVV